MTSGKVKDVFQENDIVQLAAGNNVSLKPVLVKMNNYVRIDELNGVIELSYNAGTANLSSINKFCFDNGIVLSHLQLKKSNFESKFLELTN